MKSPLKRITATIDQTTLKKIRRLAGPRGVSSFINTAARERLARLELLGLLNELDDRHGRPDAKTRAEVEKDARLVFRR